MSRVYTRTILSHSFGKGMWCQEQIVDSLCQAFAPVLGTITLIPNTSLFGEGHSSQKQSPGLYIHKTLYSTTQLHYQTQKKFLLFFSECRSGLTTIYNLSNIRCFRYHNQRRVYWTLKSPFLLIDLYEIVSIKYGPLIT